MKITLIGMSGVGKSFIAKRLEKKGFSRFSTDEFIESKLATELKKYNYAGLADISRWMGQPYEERHTARSKRYLDLERKSMQEIIRLVKHSDKNENIVIDTTGSLIYLDSSILSDLAMFTKIIYLETPTEMEEKMYQTFINDPKPIIWGDIYSQRADESEKEALARCYPHLLHSRKIKYQRLADVTVNYHEVRKISSSDITDYFINLHQNSL